MMFEVGKPFPVPGGIPHREEAHMELWPVGMVVIIQMPGLRPEELKAFKRGFKRYSYLESELCPHPKQITGRFHKQLCKSHIKVYLLVCSPQLPPYGIMEQPDRLGL